MVAIASHASSGWLKMSPSQSESVLGRLFMNSLVFTLHIFMGYLDVMLSGWSPIDLFIFIARDNKSSGVQSKFPKTMVNTAPSVERCPF